MTLVIKKQGTEILEGQEEKQSETWITPDYCLNRISGLQTSKVESRQSQTDLLSESPGRPKQLEFAGQNHLRTESTQRENPNIFRCIQHGTEQTYACEAIIGVPGKNERKELKDQEVTLTQSWAYCLLLPA